MIETQLSICEWADATFGPITDIRRAVARANEEMSEVLRAITAADIDPPHIAEECADTAIILCRVAAWAGEDLTPIFDMQRSLSLIDVDIYGSAVSANSCISLMFKHLTRGSKRDIGILTGRTILNLSKVCAGCDTTLADAIDRKMGICRKREWTLDGTGHGYHKK